jgi:type II secretory ATPase GspE/PulE/Tfp pilus assembly ATPase PilB-like protein
MSSVSANSKQENPFAKTTTKMGETQQQLVDYLKEKGLLKPKVLEAALAEQTITGEKLGVILTRNGFITRKTLVEAILKVSPTNILGEQHFSNRVPPEVLRRTRTMVVAETADRVFLASLSPEAVVNAEVVPYFEGLKTAYVPCNHDQLDDYLSELERMMHDDNNMVERLLRRALTESVSDIHIVPRYSTYSVFFRHLGVRHLAHEGPLDEYNTLGARIKDLSRMDLAERRVPQDGGFQIEHEGKIVDLRVATLPTANAEYIVIRLLDPDRVQPSLDGLGITNVEQWRAGVSRPDGLCLICGPTGSGKTTTLNASIKEMDRFGRAIYSVEDPVEYRLAYTGQVNTNPQVGLDFARAVRAFMRSDPDVIVLGEVRDPETARNAVKAAETGHLVLATLHTGSIFGAVQRLRDLEVPQHELRYMLRTVLVQRLMRIYCKKCLGKGCPVCFGNGYAGRTVVSECTYFNDEHAVTKMLNGEKWWDNMIQDAVLKQREGVTSREEVIRTFGAEAEMYFEAGDAEDAAKAEAEKAGG